MNCRAFMGIIGNWPENTWSRHLSTQMEPFPEKICMFNGIRA